MNYRCADLLNNHKPPDYSVSLTHDTSKCNNAEDGDKCRYTCMGNPNIFTRLDEQFVTLYDYSPDNSDNMLNYTEYTCKTSVKVLLKFHGKLLKGQAFPKIILSEGMSPDTTFKLITYTRQGECLNAQSIRASCNDNYDSVPVGTFTHEFYDVGLETDFSVHTSGNFGMIICSNTTETDDFATISGKFLSRGAVDTSSYVGNLEYHDISSINRLIGRSEDDNSFYLSELVLVLKRMFPGKNINLHLLTCLELDVQPGDTFTPADIIPSEPLYTKSYEWIEEVRNDCEDLPLCSYEEQEGLDLSQCNLGNPKSIRYNDRQDDYPYLRVDLESSQCTLQCLPGYDPTPLPNNSDNGNCYSYHDGTTLHTEYLNFDDGNLTRLGINCIPQNTCAAD